MINENAVAPWLVPPDYLGAMTRGAQLGLNRAEMQTNANEAGDRLRLAYAQLGSENANRGAELGLQSQHSAAALAEAAARSKALDQYRQNEIDLARERLGDSESKAARKSAAKQLLHVGGGLYSWDKDSGKLDQLVKAPSLTDPLQKAKYEDLLLRRRTIEKAMSVSGLKADDKKALQSQLDQINQGIMDIEDPFSNTTSASSLDNAAAGSAINASSDLPTGTPFSFAGGTGQPQSQADNSTTTPSGKQFIIR